MASQNSVLDRPASPDQLSASRTMRTAVAEALRADAALVTLLGGVKVYDETPSVASFPYVVIGEGRLVDFEAGAAQRVDEHHVTLHAWSQNGYREAHLIAGALLQALDDAPIPLTGHRLVSFRFAVADIRREADGRTYHALVRFRAITEPSEVGS